MKLTPQAVEVIADRAAELACWLCVGKDCEVCDWDQAGREELTEDIAKSLLKWANVKG